MPACRRISRKWLVVPVLLLVVSASASADGENEAVIRKHFKTAVDCLEIGDYKGCENALNKVLELKPTSGLALELREKTGYRFFIKLLARKPMDVLAREFLANGRNNLFLGLVYGV